MIEGRPAMPYIAFDILISLGLFVCVLGSMLFGISTGRQRRKELGEEVELGTSAVDGAVYALLGLLIAFTFSGAATRFDERRSLIVEEANDIGTAWLRLDLLPASTQPALRQLMIDYTQSRLDTYRLLPDLSAAKAQLALSQELQARIWSEATAASRTIGQDTAAAMLLLPALNAMFDITTTRTMASLKHPPRSIYIILFVMCVLSGLLAGHNMGLAKRQSLLHILAFPVIIAIVIYMILDIEHPRLGFITVDAFDQAIADVLETMKASAN
ncbi:hypothetical protein ACRDNQ_01590 [Palleronia sp. KMU-117]|uniref:bestrophin-like domain n=1 Tax=Palleronia sp. KMU-117 TaxID=3434108 RepID=UPI003D708C19